MTEPFDNSYSDEFQSVLPESQPMWKNPGFVVKPTLPPEMEGFELLNQLGSGSSGTVYRSVQTKEYAIKVVPWDPYALREAAKREYDVTRLFDNCETIIHSIAYYEFHSNSFILQELGESIMYYCMKKACSLGDLLRALLDISDALAFIHSKGYSHFDVKPANIYMIKGRAKLGDFSHSLPYTPDQEFKGPLGTEPFMAPEIKFRRKHSGLEDMYSLGINMYALLLGGAVPYWNLEDVPDKENFRFRSLFMPPELLPIIQKASAYDPHDRYQTFEEFSQDIRAYLTANQDFLDEKVPSYNSPILRNATIPPYLVDD